MLGLNPLILEIIGVINPQNTNNNNFIYKYLIYLALMLVLVLNNYVIYSNKFEKILDYCIYLENNNGMPPPPTSPSRLQEEAQQLDNSMAYAINLSPGEQRDDRDTLMER